MHKLHIPGTLNLGQQGSLGPGDFLVEDLTGAELMVAFPNAGMHLTHWQKPNLHRFADATTDLKILVAGNLSYGDCIMLTPCLRELKHRYPASTLTIACLPYFRTAFLNLDYIDGFAPWPLPAEQYDQFEEIFILERFSSHPKAKTHHLSDVFADIMGIELTDRRCDYRPTKDEIDWAQKEFPVNDRKRVGIQVQASQRCRTYPSNLLVETLNVLLKKGWEVWMMGKPGDYACQEIGHLHDLSRHTQTFRQQAAFLTTCDAFLGPDSGFLHAAGAMNIPSVGLFGAYPWKLRTAQYPSVHALSGTGDCAPCFHVSTKMQPSFPAGQSCSKTQRCTVLETIEPARIAAVIERQAAHSILHARLPSLPPAAPAPQSP